MTPPVTAPPRPRADAKLPAFDYTALTASVCEIHSLAVPTKAGPGMLYTSTLPVTATDRLSRRGTLLTCAGDALPQTRLGRRLKL